MDLTNILKQIAAFLNVPGGKLAYLNGTIVCTSSNKTINGFINIVFHYLSASKVNANLDKFDEAELYQWLEYANIYSSTLQKILQDLNETLKTRTYFIKQNLTVVDAVFYYLLHQHMSSLTHSDKEHYVNVCRWYDNLQQNTKLRQKNALIDFSSNYLLVNV